MNILIIIAIILLVINTILLMILTYIGVNRYFRRTKFEFLPKDFSLSNQEALNLTKEEMSKRFNIAEQYRELNMNKHNLRLLKPVQFIKIHESIHI